MPEPTISPQPLPPLRAATAADDAFLEDLFLCGHRDEFLPLGLPPGQLDGLLRMQARAQRDGYRQRFGENPGEIVLDPADGRTPVGRLLVANGPAELRLADIEILPQHRGSGMGTALLAEVVRRAQRDGLPVLLEVRSGNRAISLYRRMGFVEDGNDGLHLRMRFESERRVEEPAPAKPGNALATVWERQLGQEFAVTEVSGLFLRLEAVELSRLAPDRAFSLMFAGPPVPLLPQGLYTLRRAAATEDAIFLVPLGPSTQGLTYEAVFNT